MVTSLFQVTVAEKTQGVKTQSQVYTCEQVSVVQSQDQSSQNQRSGKLIDFIHATLADHVIFTIKLHEKFEFNVLTGPTLTI